MRAIPTTLRHTATAAVYAACRLALMAGVVTLGYAAAVRANDIGPVVVLVVAALAVTWFRQVRPGVRTAFGTARWATAADLRRAGMLGAGRGLLLGRVADDSPTEPPITHIAHAALDLFHPRVPAAAACQQMLAAIRLGRKTVQANPVPVRLPHAVHTAVFAPTGVGKGVSCVVPFLLSCGESAVVVDFKGENYRLTAEHRRRAFGHRVVALDPFRVVADAPDTLNPLDAIDRRSRTALDDCRDLAEALVVRTGQERDPHWADSAEAWIAALTALVVHYAEPGDRSLQTVRTLLTDPDKLALAVKLAGASDAWGGMLARLGHQLTHYKDKELGSTLTTTNRFLRFLDTLAVADSTAASSFDPVGLLGGRTTVYLVLPPEHLRAQSPLLRVWVGSLLRAVVRGGPRDRPPVHFVLDESSSLGPLGALDDAVDKYRGYGVRLQFYYQSMGQLKRCFPDGQDQTLLSNVTQVFFGVNDLATAEYVSNRLGEETIVVRSGGTSTGVSRQSSDRGEGSVSRSAGVNDNWAQHGRKLLKPEEVMALPERTAITFTPGVSPVQTRLLRYYEEVLPLGAADRPGRPLPLAQVVAESLMLLAAAGMLALAAADRDEAKRSATWRFDPPASHYRKDGPSWPRATSSR